MIKKLARRLGYSIKPLFKSDDPVDYFGMIFSRFKVGLVVDCGANLGQFHQQVRGAGYSGRIICVEPNPECHAALNDIIQHDGKTELLSIALGSEPGEAQLNVAGTTDGLTSLYDFTDLAKKRFQKTAKVSKQVNVEVKTLEALLDELSVPKDVPVFLKTDTQGNDLAVLNGAGKRIEQICGISTEMAVRHLYKNASNHWEIMDFARENGFEPYDFSTVSREFNGGLLEYDAVFVRAQD